MGSMVKRLSFRHLLSGALLALWSAALSGFALERAPERMLLLHLAGGIGGLLPIGAFLARHWWVRRHKLGGHPNARLGQLALVCLALLFLSGFPLLVWTNVAPLQALHALAALVLLLDLTLHMLWRVRRRWLAAPALPSAARPSLWRSSAIGRWLLSGALSAGAVAALVWSSYRPAASDETRSIPLAHASLSADTLPTAQVCAACHGDIAGQWQSSLHAHAATDPYYQSLTALFIQERGVDAARYCATCHNPIGLMHGEVDAHAAPGAGPAQQANAYQARALKQVLPLSAQAAEGVNCAMCHQASQVEREPRNGSLQIAAQPAALPDQALSQLVLRAAPAAHSQALSPSVLQQAQLCGSCHNLRTPDGLALEPTYDEWLASPYPAQGVNCQSCHMPPAQASRVNSGMPQAVRAHGGVPGVPSSLPGLSADPLLLKRAATLAVRAARQGAALLATVTLTNSGAGHFLPSGADDLRQVWLEVTLRAGDGRLRWQSGQLDPYGVLDASTVQFHKVLDDGNGRPIDLHRFWTATGILSDTRLAPLEARQVRYPIEVSPSFCPCALAVRLLYRDVSQAFAEFALDRAVADLPVVEMARAEMLVE